MIAISPLLYGVRAQTDFEMYGSPNHLRISFLGYFRTLYSDSAYLSTQRAFVSDKPVFDQYHLAATEVWFGPLVFPCFRMLQLLVLLELGQRLELEAGTSYPNILLMSHANGGSTKYMVLCGFKRVECVAVS
jgi:hypothetical protein